MPASGTYQMDGEAAEIMAQHTVIPPASPAEQLEEAQEKAITTLQAKVEGVPELAPTVEFFGKRFRIAEKIGLMPLMKFAHAASNQDAMAAGDMDALASIYEMLRDCIYGGNGLEPGEEGYDPGDWKKFERYAVEVKADHDELLPVVSQVIEMLTARPTREPSGSSAGQPATSRSSTANSSGRRARASTGSRRGKRAT